MFKGPANLRQKLPSVFVILFSAIATKQITVAESGGGGGEYNGEMGMWTL